MRTLTLLAAAAFGLFISSAAHAEENHDTIRPIGINLGVDLLQGGTVGVSIHPGTNILHLDAAFTYGLGPGFKISAVVDPLDFIIGPVASVSYGHGFRANVPTVDGKYDSDYVNVRAGLAVGNRDYWRISLLGGFTHAWLRGSDFQVDQLPNLQVTRQPRSQLNLFPTAELGFNLYF